MGMWKGTNQYQMGMWKGTYHYNTGIYTVRVLWEKVLNLLLHIWTLLPQWFFQTSLVYLRLDLEIRWFWNQLWLNRDVTSKPLLHKNKNLFTSPFCELCCLRVLCWEINGYEMGSWVVMMIMYTQHAVHSTHPIEKSWKEIKFCYEYKVWKCINFCMSCAYTCSCPSRLNPNWMQSLLLILFTYNV